MVTILKYHRTQVYVFSRSSILPFASNQDGYPFHRKFKKNNMALGTRLKVEHTPAFATVDLSSSLPSESTPAIMAQERFHHLRIASQLQSPNWNQSTIFTLQLLTISTPRMQRTYTAASTLDELAP
ncbi:hypothetical protein Droror1_Dr00005961 [Drosera rotundifolia]